MKLRGREWKGRCHDKHSLVGVPPPLMGRGTRLESSLCDQGGIHEPLPSLDHRADNSLAISIDGKEAWSGSGGFNLKYGNYGTGAPARVQWRNVSW